MLYKVTGNLQTQNIIIMIGIYMWKSYFPSIPTKGNSNDWRDTPHDDMVHRKKYAACLEKLIDAAREGNERGVVKYTSLLIESRKKLTYPPIPEINAVYQTALEVLFRTYGKRIAHILKVKEGASPWGKCTLQKEEEKYRERQERLSKEFGNLLVFQITLLEDPVRLVAQSCKRFFPYDMPLL